MSDDEITGRGLRRRDVLRGGAALAAALTLPAVASTPAWGAPRRRPDCVPFPKVPEGTDMLPQIEHIIVVMMENHSFDNYLGRARPRRRIPARSRRPSEELLSRCRRQPHPRLPHAVHLPARQGAEP